MVRIILATLSRAVGMRSLQVIEDGWQREVSDLWLRKGNPWELRRPKLRFPVGFGGRTEHGVDADGRLRVEEIARMLAGDTRCTSQIRPTRAKARMVSL